MIAKLNDMLRGTSKTDLHNHIESLAYITDGFDFDYIMDNYKSKNTNEIFYVALDDNVNYIGYAIIELYDDSFHLTDMLVVDEYKRQGVASRLLKFIIDDVIDDEDMLFSTLEVDVDNISAMMLYLKNGYKPSGYNSKYYKLENGEYNDALLMRRELRND